MPIAIHTGADVKELCALLTEDWAEGRNLTPADDAGLADHVQHSDGGWTFTIGPVTYDSPLAGKDPGSFIHRRINNCLLVFRQDVDGEDTQCTLIGPDGKFVMDWEAHAEGG